MTKTMTGFKMAELKNFFDIFALPLFSNKLAEERLSMLEHLVAASRIGSQHAVQLAEIESL